MKVGDKWFSLNALRTFEVAGRHMHMSRAADELGITQSAVSHQVRQLERTLEIDLSIRTGRNIRLSPAGAKLLDTVQRSFDAISTTLLTVNEDLVHGELRVSTAPGFTYLWLAKRVPKFLEKFPGLVFRRSVLPLEASELDPSYDIAVSYGDNQFQGRRVVLLAQLNFFPVCAPHLIPKGKEFLLEDINNHTLIHEDEGEAWSNWFATFGVNKISTGRDIYVASMPIAIELAKAGAGFALNNNFFGPELVVDGELVRAFDESIENYERYYLITHPLEEMSPAAKEFEIWIKEEIKETMKQRRIRS